LLITKILTHFQNFLEVWKCKKKAVRAFQLSKEEKRRKQEKVERENKNDTKVLEDFNFARSLQN